jgi:single-strand DNA-binding protein
MSGQNKAILIGNMGQDVELVYFENGGCVGKTSLATSRKWTNKQTGEVVEKTNWHNLVFRNKAAEVVEKYTRKGSKIYVEGEINYRSYEKDGNKFWVTEIMVDNFEFLSKNEAPDQPQTTEQATQAAQARGYVQKAKDQITAEDLGPEYDDDDLPF